MERNPQAAAISVSRCNRLGIPKHGHLAIQTFGKSRNIASGVSCAKLVYNPTTFSANPVSLVHLSNASAEATKAVRDDFESPDFTEANNPEGLNTMFMIFVSKENQESRCEPLPHNQVPQ